MAEHPSANMAVWRVELEQLREEDPILYEKVIRHFLLTLLEEGLMSMADLEEAVTFVAGDTAFLHWSNPNRPEPTLDETAVDALRAIVREKAADLWSDAKIQDLIVMARKKDLALRLAEMADDPFSSWAEIGRECLEFSKMPIGGSSLSLSDAMGTRVALIRRLLSDQLEYLSIARGVITIRDFAEIISRVIGPEHGLGKLGGKAAGFILAHDTLDKARRQGRPVGDVRTPHTYYIRSDVILDFLKANGLSDLANIKYREGDDLRRQYRILRDLYRTGRFPAYVIKRLSGLLKQLDGVPLIVRSSSLLEDRLGAAFCGKYASYFVANQGPMRDRMLEILSAISQVFASVFSPDAIQYRKERGLLDFREEMACIIQPVVGRRLGRYWLPSFAGVAFGSNDYTWSPRLKREDGMVRLVAGLGTRAVDRVGDDYPRIFSPGQPNLRTTTHPAEIIRYSQHFIDVVDLEANKFETVPLESLMGDAGVRFPGPQQVFSMVRDGQLIPVTGMLINVDPRDLAVTFDGLLERTGFARQMKEILDVLGETWGVPVDIEFAHDGDALYLLQCRPQSRGEEHDRVKIPVVPESKRIFSASRFVPPAAAPALHPDRAGPLGQPRRHQARRPRRLRRHQPRPHARRGGPPQGRVRARRVLRHPLLPGPARGGHLLSAPLSRRARQPLQRVLPRSLAEQPRGPPARARPPVRRDQGDQRPADPGRRRARRDHGRGGGGGAGLPGVAAVEEMRNAGSRGTRRRRLSSPTN